MKQWHFHLIYLSIIAYLGYNYWASVQAFKVFEHFGRQLRVDSEAIDELDSRIFNTIQKNCKAYKYAYNNRQYEKVVTVNKVVDSLIAFIDAQQMEFISLNGGLDPTKYASLANGNSTKTSKNFFSEAKTAQFNDKLLQLSKIFIDSTKNKWQKEKMRLPQLLTENGYLNIVKTLPANAVLAKLAAFKNQIKIDRIAFLLDVEYETAPDGWGFNTFKTAIAPKKAVLIEGEAFEADIYLAASSSNLGSNVIIKVNGEPLEIKQGVAHFKGRKETIGTKTIRAEVLIRNPLTGATTTSEGVFEYQVLPKCSRDCQ